MTGPRAASLAGLAPVTRESGTWRGRSFIREAGAVEVDAVHARSGRHPLQSRPEAAVRADARRRQAGGRTPTL